MLLGNFKRIQKMKTKASRYHESDRNSAIARIGNGENHFRSTSIRILSSIAIVKIARVSKTRVECTFKVDNVSR